MKKRRCGMAGELIGTHCPERKKGRGWMPSGPTEKMKGRGGMTGGWVREKSEVRAGKAGG